MPDIVLFTFGFLAASIIWTIGLTYVGYRATKSNRFLSND